MSSSSSSLQTSGSMGIMVEMSGNGSGCSNSAEAIGEIRRASCMNVGGGGWWWS